jgi:uncharacterized membrane protein YuzA (DUF378 family)
MHFRYYIWSIAQLLILLLSFVTNWYDSLIYALNIVMVLMVLDKLGKGIVLREIIALHCAFICLLMPLAGYQVYNTTNALSLLWVRYMPIGKNVYFDYCLPAVTGFCLFLTWPIRNERSSDVGVPLQKAIERIREKINGHQYLGLYLMITGIVMSFVVRYVPSGLQYILNLLYFSSFAGFLYIYFSGKFLYKNILLILFGVFTVLGALNSGMFTIIAYMGMTLFSFFFVGKKASMFKKTVYFLVGFLVLALIQSIKPAYRKEITLHPELNQTQLFIDLATKRLNSMDNLVSPNNYFFLYYRANQGFNIALVMRNIPSITPQDNGSYLLVKFAAAFVPRLFWPTKPEAGGLANMKYYANIDIKGYATNVGPVAEAYGSFGVLGGVIYMMALGLFIRFAYKSVFTIAQKIPLIILWIPVMFYQVTYSSENDTLQILNSLIKSSFFILILYKCIPTLFKPVNKNAVNNNNSSAGINSRLQTPQNVKV